MQAQEILSFWFGDDAKNISEEQQSQWFAANKDFDLIIKQRFGALLHSLDQLRCEVWQKEAESRLALIILLDQFTRNIFRGTGQAFAYDQQALAITLEGIECGHDLKLSVFQRVFFYMPFQHSENLSIQLQGEKIFSALIEQSFSEAEKAFSKNCYNFAVQHREIIQRFGRFPHRNKVLGRQATAEEEAYLKRGGARFGQ